MAAPIRLAGAALLTAGIANVFTPEPHRRRGYASALMAHTHDILLEAGYSAAALFGIPGFYGQFGYATIGCDFTMEVDARAAAQATVAYRLRPARQTDLPDVARMHNAVNARLDGSVIRDPSTWIGLRKGSTILGTTGLWLAEDADGQLAGYIAIREDPASAVVIDGGYREPVVAPSLVAHAAATAIERQLETISFHLHPEFGLGAYVRRMETKLESVRGCDSGYMLRILDQDAVLRAMEPALRARPRGMATRLRPGCVSSLTSARQPWSCMPTVRSARWICRTNAWRSSSLAIGPPKRSPRPRAYALRRTTCRGSRRSSRAAMPSAIGRTSIEGSRVAAMSTRTRAPTRGAPARQVSGGPRCLQRWTGRGWVSQAARSLGHRASGSILCQSRLARERRDLGCAWRAGSRAGARRTRCG